MTATNQVFSPKNINGYAMPEYWYCLQTNIQKETAAIFTLEKLSVDYSIPLSVYCPKIEKVVPYTKRVWDEKERIYKSVQIQRIQTLPLFPCYFFATEFPRAEYSDLHQRGITKLWVKSVGMIHGDTLNQIAGRENKGVVRLTEDLPIGTKAHFADGSLAEITVTVQKILYAETPMADRITILFSLLGREHTAEVSRAELRAA